MTDKNVTKKKTSIKSAIALRLGDILHDSDGLLTLVKLNLLFLFTCLPFIPPVAVFTLGPALKALTSCTNHLVKTGYLPQVKDRYMEAYKSNMIQSVKAGAITALLSVLFVFGLYFYLIMSGGNMFYVSFASVSLFMLIFIWCIAAHLFPALTEKAEENLSLKQHLSLAVAIAVSNLTKTLVAVIISAVIIAAAVLYLPASLPLVLTMVFSVPALCCAFAHTEPEFV